jgi:hypothetical protein
MYDLILYVAFKPKKDVKVNNVITLYNSVKNKWIENTEFEFDNSNELERQKASIIKQKIIENNSRIEAIKIYISYMCEYYRDYSSESNHIFCSKNKTEEFPLHINLSDILMDKLLPENIQLELYEAHNPENIKEISENLMEIYDDNKNKKILYLANWLSYWSNLECYIDVHTD